MSKFRINLNKEKDKINIYQNFNEIESPIKKEKEEKIASVGRKKGSVKAVNLKKTSVVRGYCTKQDKMLFTEFCKVNHISESAYLEKCVKKAIKKISGLKGV